MALRTLDDVVPIQKGLACSWQDSLAIRGIRAGLGTAAFFAGATNVANRSHDFECTAKLGSDTPDCRVCIYLPKTITAETKVIVHFHGGGWSICFPELENALCRQYADNLGCIVVGPDYAKAPEKYFPYALRQSHSLLAWIATPAGHGESLQNSIRMSRPTEPFIAFDTSRIGLSGGSAGGNIAIALALLVQEVPIPWPLRITAIGLQYPGLDLAQSYEDKLAVTNSAEIMPPPWMSRTFLRCYLPGPLSTDEARSSPYISPNRASDAQLAQLPPLQLVTAQHDHFRQECKAFAVRLTSLGVTTAIEDLAGVAHAFDLARTSDATRSAINERARQTSYTLLENHFRQNL